MASAGQRHQPDPLARSSRPAPVTGLVRQRLLAGEALTNVQIQQEYNRKGHVLKDVVNTLSGEGYRFTRTKVHRNVGQRPPVYDVVYQLDTSAPEQESASAAIRRRLLAGETLDPLQISEEYGVSRSLLGVVKSQMNKQPKLPRKTKKATRKPSPKRTTTTPEFTPAMGAIREQLLAGEQLDAKEVLASHGFPLRVVLADLQHKGYAVKRTAAKRPGGWTSLYRLDLPWLPKKMPAWVEEATDMPELPVAPAHVPDVVTPPKTRTEKKDVLLPEELPPDLPPLGAQVTIILHAWDPDTGEYTVGLRNGRASWLVSVR